MLKTSIFCAKKAILKKIKIEKKNFLQKTKNPFSEDYEGSMCAKFQVDRVIGVVRAESQIHIDT